MQAITCMISGQALHPKTPLSLIGNLIFSDSGASNRLLQWHLLRGRHPAGRAALGLHEVIGTRIAKRQPNKTFSEFNPTTERTGRLGNPIAA
jgi:hypothetical protein